MSDLVWKSLWELRQSRFWAATLEEPDKFDRRFVDTVSARMEKLFSLRWKFSFASLLLTIILVADIYGKGLQLSFFGVQIQNIGGLKEILVLSMSVSSFVASILSAKAMDLRRLISSYITTTARIPSTQHFLMQQFGDDVGLQIFDETWSPDLEDTVVRKIVGYFFAFLLWTAFGSIVALSTIFNVLIIHSLITQPSLPFWMTVLVATFAISSLASSYAIALLVHLRLPFRKKVPMAGR